MMPKEDRPESVKVGSGVGCHSVLTKAIASDFRAPDFTALNQRKSRMEKVFRYSLVCPE